MMGKTIRNIALICFLIFLTGSLGFYLGRRNRQVSSSSDVSQSRTTTPKEDVDLNLFWDVWGRLSRSYIDKSALDTQKMVYGAIRGMVASLDDPYTVFLPPKENQEAKDELGGKFEGIGAQLGVKDKRIVVIAPLKGMPAEGAGIRAGDWILKVDGEETTDWTLPQAVSKIRGPKGTKVTLTILHEGEQKPQDKTIVRDSIRVASVEWDKLNVKCLPRGHSAELSRSPKSRGQCEIVKESCAECKTIAHLRLSRFGDQTAEEWEKAIGEIVAAIQNGAVKGIILDLRNNPGGYLQGSIFIASEFLGEGNIVTQQNSDGSKQVYEVNRRGKVLSQPLVVLVNKGSASASEIVAGSLKVRSRAKLVGEKTFGKGSVQDTQDLPGGAGLHITVAKWLLPDGSWINGKGVEPDVKIELDEKEKDNDLQLEKAAEVLLQGS